MNDAALYDRKILVEYAVPEAREIECSVLGNDDPMASVPGEIVPGHEFYDYEAKYVDESSQLLIPAPIDPALSPARARLVHARRFWRWIVRAWRAWTFCSRARRASCI